MSPQTINYINAVRAKQLAPRVSTGDLVDVVRAAHWKHKRHVDAADRWKRVRDRALRDLERNGDAERQNGGGHAA